MSSRKITPKNKVEKRYIPQTNELKTTPKTAQTAQSNLIPILIVLAITALIFLPSLSNEFVNWDDDVNILENKNLRAFTWENIKAIFTMTVIGGYNPLTIFTFALEKHFFGLNPTIFHFNNLWLHLVCVFFAYRIALLMGFSRISSAFVALLFGIHPMRVESVAWATERKDVLFGAFYLAAIYTYIKSILQPDKKNFYLIFTFGLFVLSLFSKIQAVSLPLSMLALDYYFKRDFNIKLFLEKIPFFLGSLAVGALGIYFLAAEKTLNDDVTYFNFIDRLFIGAYSFCVYLIKLIIPYEMSPLYPYPSKLHIGFYLSTLGIAAFLGLLYWLWKQDKRALVFGMIFFTVNVMFVLQIVGAGQGFLADRFTYIPYLGLFLGMAWLYEKYVGQFSFLNSVAGIMLLACALLTFRQIGVWKNGETLWTHVLQYYQDTNLPWGNRAHYYRQNKKFALALSDYNKAIEVKAQAATFNSRGKLFFDTGDTQKAVEDYNRSIQKDSTVGEVFVNRAAAYGRLSNESKDPMWLEKAVADVEKGMSLDPKNVNAYLTAYLIYNAKRNYEACLKNLNEYIKRKDDEPEMYYERGMTKRYLNKHDEAIADMTKAIQISNKTDKNLAVFYMERARTYAMMGKKNAAQQDINEAKNRGAKPDERLIQLMN